MLFKSPQRRGVRDAAPEEQEECGVQAGQADFNFIGLSPSMKSEKGPSFGSTPKPGVVVVIVLYRVTRCVY
jgi:hypothetical protein